MSNTETILKSLDEDFFSHKKIELQDSKVFVLVDAITPFLSYTAKTSILKKLGVFPIKGKKWSIDSFLEIKKNYCNPDIYITSGNEVLLSITYQHFFAMLAVKDDRILRLAQDSIKGCRQRTLIYASWAYLYLYDERLRPRHHVPDLNSDILRRVIEDYMPIIPFSSEWLSTRSPKVKTVIYELALTCILTGSPWDKAKDVLTALESETQFFSANLALAYGSVRLLQGHPWKCETTANLHHPFDILLDATAAFLVGDFDKAKNLFERDQCRRWFRLNTPEQRDDYLPRYFLLLLFLSIHLVDDVQTSSDWVTPLIKTDNTIEDLGKTALLDLVAIRQGNALSDEKNGFYCAKTIPVLKNDALYRYSHSIYSLLFFYLVCLSSDRTNWDSAIALRDAYKDIIPAVYNNLNDFLTRKGLSTEDNLPVTYLSWLMFLKSCSWKKVFSALEAAFGTKPTEELPQIVEEKRHRLVWLLRFDDVVAEPYVQVELKSKNHWSKGKQFHYYDLKDESLTWLTKRDRDMLAAYDDSGSFFFFGTVFLPEIGLPILENHPLVFDYDTRRPIRLVQKELTLEIEEKEEDYAVKLSFVPQSRRSVYLRRCEDGETVEFYIFNEKTLELGKILKNGMLLPKEEVPALCSLMEGIPGLKISLEQKEEVRPANAEPLIRLSQDKFFYQASLRVRPAPQSSPQVIGEGHAEIIAFEDEKPIVYKRNFSAERQKAIALLDSCPTLAGINDNWDWFSEDLTEFFELLTELKEAGLSEGQLEWPEGTKFRFLGRINRSQIRIHTVKSKDNWFALTGEAKVNELTVLELSDLLQHADSKNRFVQLNNGDFLTLSEDVRRSLERLKLLTAKRKGNERAIHPLAGQLVQDICDDMEQNTDSAWDTMIKQRQAALALKPALPTTLQAELRPYQQEGFVWLSRLAAWGVGACLADDMGLGKTVQSIAVMLNEVRKGPCLIVAPTSVCPNWVEELHRFAPSLGVYRLKDADDRSELVSSMKAGMVLIISYGLLPREADLLAGHEWQMAIFDEAQALKNNLTKRSQAASGIHAHFPLALTGTPIENHLEDLWSVFDIINPGLLGTLSDFHRRFSDAAEGGASAQILKMLIKPFILRRLKGQVLDDLPELTEQTIIIEPTEKEAAFYEAVRRNAIEHVEDASTTRAQRRFNILTELTKLRRACCHASLVSASAAKRVEPVSSKMQRFLELLDEARLGGHKLLVFSQFTGHLALVRKELDDRSIPYQYLDGSTPEEKRREGVQAFQRGEGDLFLISLKAGGQGLNLTAADYVVHLDPWWNPAVEDQATDRAYRIGQKNNVTVYRLVMAHSVEEKILHLHARKRDLAADFLENTDSATQALITDEELLALLQG